MYSTKYYLYFCFLLEILNDYICGSTPVVQPCYARLDYGEISGELRFTNGVLTKTPFCSYKGIPYAKPPVGELRFKEPDTMPVEWEGLRKMDKEGRHCVQNDMMYSDDSLNDTDEDCLFLNVYSPQLEPRNANCHHGDDRHDGLPVMVWIHGGGFLFGNSKEALYGPDFLVEHHVILVTFNYRLGVFGFLNLGTDEAPGNVGLKDQVAVLAWVKNNIHKFNGDPNRVTIFGESAGAASVQYHLLSEMSQGLFERAIMQSGSVLAPWAFNKDVKKKAFLLGKLLNCSSSEYPDDVDSLASCLREASSEQLRNSQILVTDKEDFRKGLYFTFLPSIETPGTGCRNFLTKHPMSLLKNGFFQKVPTMVGFNDLEGFMFLKGQGVTPEFLTKMDKDLGQFVPKSLGLRESSREYNEVKAKIRQFYFDNKQLSWDSIKQYCDLLGDYSVVIPVYMSLLMMKSHAHNKPIYSYEFAVDGDRGQMKRQVLSWKANLTLPGASHFDDIGYLFNSTVDGLTPLKNGSVEWGTVERVTTLWTNFAKTGNPNGNGFGGWEPQQKFQDSCLVISDSRTEFLNKACEHERTQFWRCDIYNKYYNKTMYYSYDVA